MNSQQLRIHSMKLLTCILMPLLIMAAAVHDTMAQAQSPAAATALFREARDFIGDGEWQRAETAFNRFIADFPKDPQVAAALYWLAFSLKQQNKFPAADAALTRLIEGYPNQAAWQS